MWYLLLLFFLTCISAEDALSVHALAICKDDPPCTQTFYLDTQNDTLFYWMFRDVIAAVNQTLGFADVPLLSDSNLTWALWLTSRRDLLLPIRCDVNHLLLFYPSRNKYECQCKTDRSCDRPLYATALFNGALIAFAILILMIASVSLFTFKQFRAKINGIPSLTIDLTRVHFNVSPPAPPSSSSQLKLKKKSVA